MAAPLRIEDDRTPAEVAGAQLERATAAILRPEHDYTPWPFHAMNELAGPLIPGDRPTILAAYSGQGKTAFTTSAIAEWVHVFGRKCYVMPLENRAETWRTTMAAMLTGVHPGAIFTGEYLRWKNVAEVQQNLRACLEDFASGRHLDNLYVSDAEHVNLATFQRAAEHAHDMGMEILLVDHVDEIIPDDFTSPYTESVRICREARRIAQRTGLRVILCSQLNNEIAKASPLSRYHAPEVQHLYFGQHKAQVASTVLGLYRPIRNDVSQEQVKRVNAKEAEPDTVLERNIMGAVLMKSGHGKTVGKRAKLWIDQGKVSDLPPEVRAQQLAAQHGIRL